MIDVAIVGGGAAGFFTAINLKENRPDLKVVIYEKSKQVLSKVKVSGGGRCNVTHACFIPKDLTKNYPRGKKELLGPFHTFMTGDTMEWFESRGVPMKIEGDGRIFPESNSSQTIIDCFQKLCSSLDIPVKTGVGISSFVKDDSEVWKLQTKNEVIICKYFVLTPGASKSLWKEVEKLGHTVVDPIPSLFTFNIADARIADIPGLSVSKARCSIEGEKFKTKGPILVTHWGLSGPAILKLSAESARALHLKEYRFKLFVNWMNMDQDEVLELIEDCRADRAKSIVIQRSIDPHIPRRLWEKLVVKSGISPKLKWGDLSKKQINLLLNELCASAFEVNGKSTFKEEFVTCGGVSLREINFKTYESKLHENLFMAGEFIDVDAVTGGFNFQNAWTGGFLISQSISSRL